MKEKNVKVVYKNGNYTTEKALSANELKKVARKAKNELKINATLTVENIGLVCTKDFKKQFNNSTIINKAEDFRKHSAIVAELNKDRSIEKEIKVEARNEKKQAEKELNKAVKAYEFSKEVEDAINRLVSGHFNGDVTEQTALAHKVLSGLGLYGNLDQMGKACAYLLKMVPAKAATSCGMMKGQVSRTDKATYHQIIVRMVIALYFNGKEE